MPLIIEDGTGVEDANTYIDLADARELASTRGIILSAEDSELSSQLVSAADRLTSYEARMTGCRMTGAQGLSYPRNNSYRYGSIFPNTSIPKELKLAQVTLAGLMESGVIIWGLPATGIKSETVGPLETVYTDSGADSVGNPDLPQIDSILEPLFISLGLNFKVGR